MKKRINTGIIATIMAAAVLSMGLVACAEDTLETEQTGAPQPESSAEKTSGAQTESSTDVQDVSTAGIPEDTPADKVLLPGEGEAAVPVSEYDWITLQDIMNNPDFEVTELEEVRDLKFAQCMKHTYEATCKKCGNTFFTDTQEVVFLDDDFARGAEAIIILLMQPKLDKQYENTIPESYTQCGQHPSDVGGFFGNENTVKDINVINNRFMTVNYVESSAIGGGAMFSHDRQEVYDLEEGDKLDFKDFFKGTKEDFVNIVKNEYKGDENAVKMANMVFEGDPTYHIEFLDNQVLLYSSVFDLTGDNDFSKLEYQFTYQELFGTDSLTR